MTWVPAPVWAAAPPEAGASPSTDTDPDGAQPQGADAEESTTGDSGDAGVDGPTAPPPDPDPGPGDCAGESEEPPTYAETLGRQTARVKCLDESHIDEFGRTRARKGVQPKRFTKGGRVVLNAAGGAYGGDLVSTNWQAGGGLGIWFTEDWGVEGQFRAMPVDFRLERAATGFNGEDRFPDDEGRMAYAVNAHLMWAPIHTKLKAGRERVVHGDFAVFGGAGKTFHDTVQGVSFDVGASFYLYPTRFLSFRIDLADHILSQEVLGSRRISNNLMFSVGLGIWIPFRLKGKRLRKGEENYESQVAEDFGDEDAPGTDKTRKEKRRDRKTKKTTLKAGGDT